MAKASGCGVSWTDVPRQNHPTCWRFPLSVYYLLPVCVLISLSDTANAIRPIRLANLLNREEAQTPRHYDYTYGPTAASHEILDGDVQELFLDQPLDHFSMDRMVAFPSEAEGSMRQRYFYTDRYMTQYSEGTPFSFVCVGGEGPSLDKSVLIDSVHCSGDMIELARILHEDHNVSVHLYALEHRYYGLSFPTFQNTTDTSDDDASPSSNAHLTYLSSRQALADVARFIQEQHLPVDTKWVTFGGSYPGMLAAWARLLYPHLVYAAVSNSAPIQATLDFDGYNELVGLDLRYQVVGGSNACLETIVKGHEEILQAIGDKKYELVASMFGICNASSLMIDRNVDMFVGDGVIEIPAQENDPFCTSNMCNLKSLCAVVIDESKSSTAMDTLATVARIQRDYQRSFGGSRKDDSCTNLNWEDTLEYLSSPVRAKHIRSWLWQTCTEFGFYQTCKDTKCPYGRGHHTLDMDFEICKTAFGIDQASVRRNVNQTLDFYGGWNLLEKNATRILSVNGNVDPWSMLGLVDSNDQTLLPTHWVEGASHHFWTHPIKSSDDEHVVKARGVIYQKVMKWLYEEDRFTSPL